ncbi:hypothetical protein BGZ99_003765, partial [Dissophora globulifera]
KLSCGITSAGPSPGSPSLLPEDNGDTFGSPVGGAVGDLNFSPTAAATRLSRPTGAECDCPALPTGVLDPADAVAAAAAARLSGPVTGAGGDGDPTPAPTTEMPSPAGAVAGGDSDGPAGAVAGGGRTSHVAAPVSDEGDDPVTTLESDDPVTDDPSNTVEGEGQACPAGIVGSGFHDTFFDVPEPDGEADPAGAVEGGTNDGPADAVP